MGLFCGKKCKCKKRCEDFFSGIIAHRDRCKNACKNNKNLSPEEFLLTLTEQQQAAYRGDIPTVCYDQNGNLLSQEYLQSLIEGDSTNMSWAGECLEHAPPEAKKMNPNTLIFILIAGIAFVSYIIYKKS